MVIHLYMLPGYTVIKKANETLADRDNITVDKFEVFDLKNMMKTDLVIDTPINKLHKKVKKKQPVSNVVQISSSHETKNEQYNQDIHIATQQDYATTSKEVLFIAPYTEISIQCLEVHIDNNIISIITDKNDKVKVKPARGATMSVRIDEIEYNVYSSGIYIPINKLNCIMSIFFIMDETTEP